MVFNKKRFNLTQIIFCIIGVLFMSISAHAQMVHPGLSHKTSDLERMKYMVEAEIEPFYSSYQDLKADSRSSYNYTVQGDTSMTVLYRSSPSTNQNEFENDARAAYHNALMWAIDGDERHAEKAVEIFNAWTGLTYLDHVGTRALTSCLIYQMIEAAEIIKSTYTGWSTEDIAKFKAMLVYPGYSNTEVPEDLETQGTWYWRAYLFDYVRAGNQELSAIRACMAMGVFLDNEIMYDRALRYVKGLPHRADDLPYSSGPHIKGSVTATTAYRESYNYTIGYDQEDYGFNGVLTNYIWENGQAQESSRDLWHTWWGIHLLAGLGEMAWNQGDDFWGASDSRILLGNEYHNRYTVSYVRKYDDQPTEWTPTVESGEFIQRMDATNRNLSLAICPIYGNDETRFYRDRFNEVQAWELPIAHYVGRGLKTPEEVKWTLRARDLSLEMNGSYETVPASGNGSYLGFGALAYRRADFCYGDPISAISADSVPVFAMPVVPCTIEAEHYDYFPINAEGLVYHDVDTVNTTNKYRLDQGVDIDTCSEGGYALTSLEGGEWVTYTLNVPTTSLYNISIRYASANANGKLKFSFEGEDKTEELVVPFGGEYSTGLSDWKDYAIAHDIVLNKGVQAMKISISGDANSFVLNAIKIEIGSLETCVGALPSVVASPRLQPGISCTYYDGTWDAFPSFDTLTAYLSTQLDSVQFLDDISATSGVLVFDGYMEIPVDGSYTFYNTSEGALRLFVDGVEVLNNADLLELLEQSADVCLDEGFHNIRVEYMQNSEDEALHLIFSGPSFDKQKLTKLYTLGSCDHPAVDVPEDLVSGVYYKYYTGEWDYLPDFSTLSTSDGGVTATIDVSKAKVNEYYGLTFDAYINITTEGDYTFYTTSDDGSSLWIDGEQVIYNFGAQEIAGSLCLEAGYHQLRVEYFNNSSTGNLSVMYEGPDFNKTTISNLYTEPAAARLDDTIVFPEPFVAILGDDDFDAGITCASGRAMTYHSANINVATIVDDKIHIVGVGTSYITAFLNANEFYNMSYASKLLTITETADILFDSPITDLVSMYPNPVLDELNIIMSGISNANLEILNHVGIVVLSQKLTAHETQINLSNLPHGVYIVRVSSDKGMWTQKIVKE